MYVDDVSTGQPMRIAGCDGAWGSYAQTRDGRFVSWVETVKSTPLFREQNVKPEDFEEPEEGEEFVDVSATDILADAAQELVHDPRFWIGAAAGLAAAVALSVLRK